MEDLTQSGFHYRYGKDGSVQFKVEGRILTVSKSEYEYVEKTHPTLYRNYCQTHNKPFVQELCDAALISSVFYFAVCGSDAYEKTLKRCEESKKEMTWGSPMPLD